MALRNDSSRGSSSRRAGRLLSCGRSALLLVSALVANPSELRPQENIPTWQSEARSQPRLSLNRPHPPPREQARTNSTLLERTLWGAGAGALVLLGSTSGWDPDRDREPLLLAYPVGSILGITLVTRAREGARPIGVILGTAVGASIPLLLDALLSDPSGDMLGGSDVALGFMFLVTVPLGGAIGHTLGP